jgi:hypothetical protein
MLRCPLDGVLPKNHGEPGRQAAPGAHLRLPGRVGPGGRQAPHRLAALPGSADEVAARLSQAGPGEPTGTRHRAFGDLAAAWSVLERLEVAAIIDQIVGARRADAACSVGTYLPLACLNRVVAPRSKLGFAAWWQTTAGDRLHRLPAAALDHRRFWDAMHAIRPAQLVACKRQRTARMVAVFGLDLQGWCWT